MNPPRIPIPIPIPLTSLWFSSTWSFSPTFLSLQPSFSTFFNHRTILLQSPKWRLKRQTRASEKEDTRCRSLPPEAFHLPSYPFNLHLLLFSITTQFSSNLQSEDWRGKHVQVRKKIECRSECLYFVVWDIVNETSSLPKILTWKTRRITNASS